MPRSRGVLRRVGAAAGPHAGDEPAGEANSSPAPCAAPPAREPAGKASPTRSLNNLRLDVAFLLGAAGAAVLGCLAGFVLREPAITGTLLVVTCTFLGCAVEMRLGPLLDRWICRMAGSQSSGAGTGCTEHAAE